LKLLEQNYCFDTFKVDYTFWLGGRKCGEEGNKLVDRIAKQAAVGEGPVVYDKIPKEVIIT
jgi:hypothetical protein